MNILHTFNWRLLLKIYLVISVFLLMPYLPISSYLHEFSMEVFAFLSIAGFVIVSIWSASITIGTVILLFLWAFQTAVFKDRFFKYALIVLYTLPTPFLAAYLILNNHFWVDMHRNAKIEKGTQIVNALEAYKNDHQVYPYTLEDLCPQYLRALPKNRVPVVSNFYYQKKDSTFTLYFYINANLIAMHHVEYFPVQNQSGWDWKKTRYPQWVYYVDYSP